MLDVLQRKPPVPRACTRELGLRPFWVGVGALSAALAGVLASILQAWPPHEDETLALFVGRGSLGHVLHTVIGDRGGAPLHFLFAWAVAHAGGGLSALRIVSLVFAVASVPAIATLAARLADRTVGLVAAVLASGSWVLLFHGIYGRMYSLFLFTSALSFLALLAAIERGGRRRFAVWGAALVAVLASHPYGILVLGGQCLFVLLRRRRLRLSLITLVAVAVAGTPFWWADSVLRHRFDVGVGGGGPQLGSPAAVARYLWSVAGDFSAGQHEWLPPVMLVALAGFVLLARRRRESAVLTACVVVVPAIAFLLARLHGSASPQARHLIFALPFFSTLLATALVELGRIRPPITGVAATAGIAVLLVGETQWADRKTPALFHGDPVGESQARHAAAAWLASTARPDDVLLGYEPVYLAAWQRNRSFSRLALPRADPALMATALLRAPEPLGRGVWVFDASDTTNTFERPTIPLRRPRPTSAFEARAYGPYLVIRSRDALGTPARYLEVSERVMELGRELRIGDADVNLHTMLIAAQRL